MNTDGAYSLPFTKTMSDGLPPQNLEAERCVLGGILLDNDVMHDVAQFLAPEDFYREAYQTIYRAAVTLYDRGEPIDGPSLMEELSRAGAYKLVGGDDVLAEIASSVPHSVNAQYHAGIVREKSISRRLIQTATEIVREGYAGQQTARELLDAAERKVLAIGQHECGEQAVGIEPLLLETFQAIQSREDRAPRGVLTGFDDLDYHTDGFKPQALVIVAARPSMGKTAFACSAAVNAAKCGVPVLLFSLEMDRASLGERLLSAESGVSGNHLRRPAEMGFSDRNNLAVAMHRLSQIPLILDDRSSRTVSQMAAAARRIKSRKGLGLVVIDYLSLIDGQRQRGENRQEEVARISRRLKAMARELDCPVLCLHQLNRQSESRDGHRPRLADLRESGQIEQDADQVLLLHRPDYYDPNDQPGIAEVIVAKNRNGPTGAVRLTFHRDCTKFAPLS